MAISALLSAFLAGALGGVHCLAMCGGFLTAISGSGAAAKRLLPARTLALRQLPHNLGRISTYVVLGAVFGAAGSVTLLAVDWQPLQRGAFVVANLFLLALAAAIAWRSEGALALQVAGAALFRRVAPAVGSLSTIDTLPARYAVGLLWGLVPCALIYSVLPIALFAGGAAQGAAVMLAFGLGTLPNLLAAGYAVVRARDWLDGRLARYVTAAVVAAFALAGIWRALFGTLGGAHGAFCF
jgi:sulfite exporter TauE/SafE